MRTGSTSQLADTYKGRLDYIKVGSKLPHPDVWQKLLIEWCSAMSGYASQSLSMSNYILGREGDVPYWHVERSDVGFLAAAIWRLGGVAIQEFAVTRGQGEGDGDLWFKLDELECHIEAKKFDEGVPSIDLVNTLLGKAKSELLVVPDNEKSRVGMALCFAVPVLTSSSFDFRSFVKSFERDDSLVAVYLPGPEVNIKYEGDNYPGVALIGQLAWGEIDKLGSSQP